MLYTQDEVMDFVSEENIKFIRLAFFDALGVQKNVSVMPENLRAAFERGVSFDASAVLGLEPPERSDLFLHPDPSTIAVLPWRPSDGRVVRMYCDIRRAGGAPYEKDCRHILKEAARRAADAGYEISFGAEIEFYLFKLDEKGEPTLEPIDRASYMDIAPADKGENIRRNICFALSDMGITPETSHHEEGPGQNEIDFRYSDALTAADNCAAFKWAVSSIAAANGVWADFSPKPLEGMSGSGFHINISARKKGAKSADNSLLENVAAGILNRIHEITLFLNPTPASYKRLGGHKAPQYADWGAANRTALIRLPETNSEARRAELRSPDPQANPYTAFALLIEAAVEGIKSKAVPPAKESSECLTPLPRSFDEAFSLAAKSDFVKSVIPQSFIGAYARQGAERQQRG